MKFDKNAKTSENCHEMNVFGGNPKENLFQNPLKGKYSTALTSAAR